MTSLPPITHEKEIPYSVAQLAKYKHSINDFFEDCVWTLNQANKQQPVMKYPSREAKPYLYWTQNTMVEEPLLALVKHRRMIITWTYCGVALHDAMFREGRFNALVSKKEEDSDDLVKRVKFIYDHIPEDKLPLKPEFRYKYTEFRCEETDSVVKGVASGKDQLRQYTCSRVGCDEMAFWPACRDTYTALKPTLEGGGQVCLFSTRYPGFFQQIIDDTIDDDAVAV